MIVWIDKLYVLFKILQSKISDVQYCIKRINNFKNDIKAISTNFNDFWNNVNEIENLENLRVSRQDSNISSKEFFSNLLKSIINQIFLELDNSFSSLSNFEFLKLSDTTKYAEFEKSFPEYLVSNLQNSYPGFFDISVLKTELKVVFKDNNFKSKKNIQEIVKFLIETELEMPFSEFFKLLKLMLTFPVSTASVEKSFSCLKRIKTFLRNRCSQLRLSNLVLISIEKELLQNLKQTNNFYDRVIDHFALKERRIELKFKN